LYVILGNIKRTNPLNTNNMLQLLTKPLPDDDKNSDEDEEVMEARENTKQPNGGKKPQLTALAV
jgi:hypothetical protein